MTVNRDKLFSRLLKTRDSLYDVCEELGIDVPEEDSLKCLQCSQCSIWRAKGNFMFDEGMPVCDFCQDLQLLRF